MAHSAQKVEVKLTFGSRVGEDEAEIETKEFIGSPEVPMTDDDVADARVSAFDQAIAYLSAEKAKYAREPASEQPRHERDEPAAAPGTSFGDKPEQ